MIKLRVEEYCQKCSDFQPSIEKLYAGGEIAEQIVCCEYRERCANISKFICEKMRMEKESDDQN